MPSSASNPAQPRPSARVTLALLATAELLAMSLWFTGTAVLPRLVAAWGSGLAAGSWLTISVQLGFVAGALLVALLNLSDVFPASRVFVVSASAAAAVNALFAATAESHVAAAITLRFLTGAFLAGVYPTGMKLLAGWFRQGRGLALGVLVGALTVGSALPHGVNAFGGFAALPWQAVVLTSSAFALLAAILVALWVREGPYAAASPPVHLGQVGELLRNRRLALANLGYLGHMWELYSMWGWIAIMLAAAAPAGVAPGVVSLVAFLTIALGGAGCVWAGLAADQGPSGAEHGLRVARRAWVTIVSMAVSGVCCLLAALVFPHFLLLALVSLVWGLAVVADSAQFSAIVSEVSDQRYVGTALTMQTALGFLLTTVSLRAVAAIAESAGWRWAALSLAIGPALGILAMWPLARKR